MKKILLPTDFSDASLNAIAYAVQLFKNEDCTFYVLNTYAPVALYTATAYGSDPGLNMDIGEIFKKTSEKKVQQVIDTTSAAHKDDLHHYKGISSFNMLNVEVDELIDDLDLDLVVMGTNGASGLKEVFIGSQTMQVIKDARVPVIGVPAGYAFKQPTDILFSNDYKTGTFKEGLSLLEQLCEKYTSSLVFLEAYDDGKLTEKQVENKTTIDNHFHKYAQHIQSLKGMETIDAMQAFQSKHPIDLLVLVHNKTNFFENLLFTPVVQKIAHHAAVPFLILPPYKKN
jgi:nucleotide-binding universal stress UspA family protein